MSSLRDLVEITSNNKESFYSQLKPFKQQTYNHYFESTPKSKHKSSFCSKFTKNSRNIIRRMSCYCSECGILSKFQLSVIDVPQIKPFLNKKKTIIVSKTQSTSNFDDISPGFDTSPLLKKNSIIQSRKALRHAIHCRFRKSLLLLQITKSEEKKEDIQSPQFQIQQKKSSLCNLDQIQTMRTVSKQQSPLKTQLSPQRNIPLLQLGFIRKDENYKPLTFRTPQNNNQTSPKRYPNIYLQPLTSRKKQTLKTEITYQKQDKIQLQTNSSIKRVRHCASQI